MLFERRKKWLPQTEHQFWVNRWQLHYLELPSGSDMVLTLCLNEATLSKHAPLGIPAYGKWLTAAQTIEGPLLAFPVTPSWPFSPDDEGSGSKRPKVELSEEELKAHVSKGTLGKLTVPMLKEVCRVYGLKGGLKKQELMNMLTKHFQKNWPETEQLATLLYYCQAAWVVLIKLKPVSSGPGRVCLIEAMNFTFMRLSVAMETA